MADISPPKIQSSSSLPTPQLESLRFKASQIIDSIQALQRTLLADPVGMPAWPDVLSKYNVLLSQTYAFSTGLAGSVPVIGAVPGGSSKAYEKIVLHPISGMPDVRLDNEVIPLLRNQQTTDVLQLENETVKRLAERMETRGSIGVLSYSSSSSNAADDANRFGSGGGGGGRQKKPTYADVLNECASIRAAHDSRVDRAVRAVGMLRDKYEWKARVEVEVEEPEELGWDPRVAMGVGASGAPALGGDGLGAEDDEDDEEDDEDDDDEGGDVMDVDPGGDDDAERASDENEVEGVLNVNGHDEYAADGASSVGTPIAVEPVENTSGS